METPAFLKKLSSSVLFYACCIPGAIGGIASMVISYPYGRDSPLHNLDNLALGLPLVIVFGAITGLAMVVVLTNADRADTPRLLVLSFAAGFSWNVILPRILATTSPGSETGLQAQLSNAFKVPGADVEARASKVEPSLREGYAFLDANEDAQRTLEQLAALSGEDLQDYELRQRSPLLFDTTLLLLRQYGLIDQDELSVTPLGQQLLQELAGTDVGNTLEPRGFNPETPDAVVDLFVDIPLFDQFSEYYDNWYRVTVTEPGYYTISTAGSDTNQTDTVITLYAEDGVTYLGSDDDGNVIWPYSLLSEYLNTGTYVIEVSNFRQTAGDYTLIVEAEGPMSYDYSAPTFLRSELQAAPILPGQPIVVNLDADATAVYKFTLGPDEVGSYVFATSGGNEDTDPTITLYSELVISGDSQGVPDESDLIQLIEIGREDDSEESLHPRLSEFLTEGVYYLEVSHYTWDSTSFTLTISPE